MSLEPEGKDEGQDEQQAVNGPPGGSTNGSPAAPVVVVTRYPQGGVDLDINFGDGRPVRRMRFRAGQRRDVDDTLRYLRARNASITETAT